MYFKLYNELAYKPDNDLAYLCQFLIGNVFQLISSVSNNNITLFSVQNQSKIHKKAVDLKQLISRQGLILLHSAIFFILSRTSTGFFAENCSI